MSRWTGPVVNPTNPLSRLIKPVNPPSTPNSDAGAHWLWCTVSSAYPDPVQVVPDSSSDPLPGAPSMMCHVDLGDRVLVLLWRRRMVVLGVAQPDQSQNIPAASGTVLVTPVTVGAVVTADVVFDVPFDQVPAITVTPSTTSPQSVFASYQNATVTGFTIYLCRTDNTSPTGVSWTATT